MNSAVRFENVKKSFGEVPVLRGIDFELGAGRSLGLVGENGAGKSTLMNILGGVVRPDGGRMFLHSKPYAPAHPTDATRAGVAFIHQELNLFPNLTIAENLFLTAFPRVAGVVIDRKEMGRRAAALLAQIGLEVAPNTLVERLSAGERQLVEIARALSFEPRVIIFDEPTTSLSARETDVLFGLMGRLRANGITMIYISHILEHVLRLCDDILVLRDGSIVGHGVSSEFTIPRLITLMVNRQLGQLYPERTKAPATEPAFAVKDVTEPGIVRSISFTVHRGELLGIFGLMGAGRSELARILFGLDSCASGETLLQGALLHEGGPRSRIARGLGFVTEDRRHEGLCLEGSVADNLALVSLRKKVKSPLWLLDMRGWREAIGGIREAVRLPAHTRLDQPVKNLSGGNQQKVVLGKWLLAGPAVLILDEPTRGVDVGAKFDLYRLIHDLADGGTGVLMISSEIEELMGVCDRILVMSQGAVRAEFRRAEFNREKLLAAALPKEERV